MPSKLYILYNRSAGFGSAPNCFRTGVLLCLTGLFVSISQITSAGPEHLSLHGIFEFQNQLHFSLKSKQTGRSGWIAVNKDFEGLRLVTYDSAKRQAYGLYLGEQVTIKLPNPKFHGLIVSMDAEDDPFPIETGQSITELQRSLYSQLPEKNNPLHGLMKQSIDNRISSLKASLNRSQNTAAEAITEVAANSINEAVRLAAANAPIRTRNRVNSRIWASDHIEIHGLSSEAQ
jgi:hypothetical protein